MNSDFNILAEKMNAFTRKYFLFRFLRGFFFVLFTFVAFYLVFSLVEYWLYLSAATRSFLFLTAALFFFLAFVGYVLLPLIRFLGILNPLNYRKASELIQLQIPEIQDKLLNIIELHDHSDATYSVDITRAAIDQKIAEIKIFDFSSAVNFKNLRTLSLYLLSSIIVVVFIFLVNKSVLIESGNRIIHFKQEFVKPAPFTFTLLNQNLEVEKGENFTLKVECNGKELPSLLYVNIGGNNYLMDAEPGNTFEYNLNAVIQPIDFYFTDLKYRSANYRLDIVPVPVVNHFSVTVQPPGYTGLPAVKQDNIGDLQVPSGSLVSWQFECFDTDSLYLLINREDKILAQKEGQQFTVQTAFKHTSVYEVFMKSQRKSYEPVMNFRVEVTEDLYPEIKLVQLPDSFKYTRFYFKGMIHDDYGFSALSFHVNIDNIDSAIQLPFVGSMNTQDFYYTVDLMDFNSENKAVTYYFTVSDNDRVNGFKTTTSESFVFSFPSKQEIAEKRNNEFQDIEKLMERSQDLARELKSDLQELRLKNMNPNTTDWEKSQMVENMLSKKSELESIMESIEKQQQQLNNFQNTFSEQKEDILKKQEELQQLLENVFTDELKKLLEEFSKLAEEFNSEKLNRLSKQMDFSFDDLSKQLDRNLELLKKMKLEQDFQLLIDRVTKTSESQDQLSKQVGEERSFENATKQVLSDLQELQEIEKEIGQLLKENEQLQKPLILDDFDNEFGEIRKLMQQSLDEIKQKSRRNSSRNLQNSAQQLKNLAFAMQQMLKTNTLQQNMENIDHLRQILSNLLILSFDQEAVLNRVATSTGSDPVQIAMNRKQKDLIDHSQIIKDSLYALAGRAPQVSSTVNNELLVMELNLNRASELLNEGLVNEAAVNQQFVITAANNLALLLSDVLKQIEDQMNSATQGDESCEPGKPGGPPMNSMKKQAENIKQQLERMIEEMRKGNGKPTSRQLSESLIQHEMFQQMLRELMNNGQLGNESRKQLMQIDQLLEQNRQLLMNKQVNPVMINRQKEILSRLLEAEKAEMERDQDNKRESNTADDKFYSNPARFFELQEKSNVTIEDFERNSLKLNNFYQKKFKNYVENMNDNVPR